MIPDTLFVQELFRNMGRISFPIFGFMVIYSSMYFTKNIEKFLLRLFVFGILTQPFAMYFTYYYFSALNIMFTLFSGVGFVYLQEKQINTLLKYILFSFVFLLSLFSDYSLFGFLYMVMVYFYLKKQNVHYILGVVFFSFLMEQNFSIYSSFVSVLTVLLLVFCVEKNYIKNIKNKKNRKIKNKYLFYLLYPLQFLLIKYLVTIV